MSGTASDTPGGHPTDEVPDLPEGWHGYADRLAASGRVGLARDLADLPGLGIEPGGCYEGRAPRPGERAVALYDDVRVLVGDDAVRGMAERLRTLPVITSAERVQREHVDVIGSITDDRLLAAVIADLAVHGVP